MSAHDSSAWAPGNSAKWQASLTQLLEASFYAHDLACDPWQFAIECDVLRAAGLTINDLAWLIAKGYLVESPDVAAGCPSGGRERRDSGRRVFDSTSFVLTASGMRFAAQLCRPIGSDACQDEAPPASPVPNKECATVPRWDLEKRQLWLGDLLIKQLRVPARNQDIVLAALHEAAWPHSVDDPLPPSPGVDARQRLRYTIIRLNRGHTQSLIRFHGNGTGRAVYWEPLAPAPPRRT